MTTSNSTDYSITRNKILRQALLLCNGIEEDEIPSATTYDIANEFLNMYVKKINVNFPLWGTIDYIIPLYDLKQSYTLGLNGNKNIARPLKLTQGRRLFNGHETPVEQVGRQVYMELSLKASQSPVNQFYYDAQLTQGVLYVWGVSNVMSTAVTSWVDSGTTPGEYYDSNIIIEPEYVFNNGTEQTKGTLGSLVDGEYGWGDQDAIGFNTLYLFDTTLPTDVKILTQEPDKIIVTAHRPLEDFDDADHEPDFPQEAFLMLVFGVAELLCPMYDTSRLAYLTGKSRELLQEFLASDTEVASFSIHPSRRH